METTPYIWLNGKIIPWKKAQVHVLTHSLHYGAAVFEGIRVYKTAKGPAIFRLEDHVKRLFFSAKAIHMKLPWTEKQFTQAVVETVKKNKLKQGYIRPLLYYGYGKMGMSPIGAPVEGSIACWPWGKYLPDRPVRVKISPVMRIHPKSSKTDAKISGHYVNSIMAKLDLVGTDYDEALLLDHLGHIAEGPGENFFMVKKGVLYTPKLGTILKGITRSTVLEIAKYYGISTQEKVLLPKDALQADEAFFTGTAAEVTPIGFINNKKIVDGKTGPVTQVIQQAYMDIVFGKNPDFQKYLTYC